MAKTKADYYNWLMKRHDMVSDQIKKIPKISLDQQAKSAILKEYDDTNQRKVNFYKKILDQISGEAHRIMSS